MASRSTEDREAWDSVKLLPLPLLLPLLLPGAAAPAEGSYACCCAWQSPAAMPSSRDWRYSSRVRLTARGCRGEAEAGSGGSRVDCISGGGQPGGTLEGDTRLGALRRRGRARAAQRGVPVLQSRGTRVQPGAGRAAGALLAAKPREGEWRLSVPPPQDRGRRLRGSGCPSSALRCERRCRRSWDGGSWGGGGSPMRLE